MAQSVGFESASSGLCGGVTEPRIPPAVADALAGASDADVRAFLLDEMQRDERMAMRFAARFGKQDLAVRKKSLRSELAAVRKEYARGGFIDYRDSWGFEVDYQDVLESYLEPSAQRGDADALFALLDVAIMHFRGVHIDDSNGFVTGTMDMLNAYYEQAFSATPADCVPARIRDVCKLADTIEGAQCEGDFDDLIAPELRFIPARLFAGNSQFAAEIVGLADERIACLRLRAQHEREELRRRWPGLAQKNPETKTTSDYEAARWALARMEAMESLGEGVAALREFAHPFFDDSSVLVAFADACSRAGEPRVAVADLEAGANDGRLGPDGMNLVRLRLLDAYAECGMDAELRELLRAMLQADQLPFRGPSAAELLARYRATVSAESWSQAREELFAGMANRYTLCDCLLAEGMPERIYQIAKDGERFDVERYQDALLQIDAPFVLAWHKRRVLRDFEEAYDRKGYRRKMKELVRLLELPGGKDAAQEVADELRARYPRKVALLDELAKAGL